MINRKNLLLLAFAPLLAATPAAAGDVGINIHIGAPALPPVPIIVPEPPLFLVPPPLGFAIAVGVPYDLILIDGRYYLFHDRVWHVGPGYNGPWKVIGSKHLPPHLRRHKIRSIHEYRDREYGRYQKEKKRYRGKAFRPERGHDHRRRGGHDDGHYAGKDHDRRGGHDDGPRRGGEYRDRRGHDDGPRDGRRD